MCGIALSFQLIKLNSVRIKRANHINILCAELRILEQMLESLQEGTKSNKLDSCMQKASLKGIISM